MKNVTSAVSLISTVCHVTDWGVQKCNSKSLTKARTSARKDGQLESDKFYRSAATALLGSRVHSVLTLESTALKF